MKTNKLVITLFGATGDLVAKKILPSIKQLIERELLSKDVAIFALGRRNFDTEQYLSFIKDKNPDFEGEILKDVLGYLQMDITNQHDFYILKNAIKSQTETDTVFVHFLALSQDLALIVSNYLSVCEIVKKNDTKHRIIIEKPFGSNLKTSKILKNNFWKIFSEEQLYRIDHYLGKEMVKKMYEIRFYNDKVLSFLKNERLKKLSVMALEKNGILERGGYYDQTGATKDMFQNHLLQLVSLSLMDKPSCHGCEEFTNNKVEIVKSLRLVKNKVIFGQYDNYFKEKNVSAFSKTETFLFAKLYSKKRSLKNVEIEVLTAKKTKEKLTELVLEYTNNKKIEINFFPKKQVTLIESKKSTELLSCEELLLPYARLLLDAYKPTKRFFVRFDEIESAWKVTDKILKYKKHLIEYKSNIDLKNALKLMAGKEILNKL